jgi:pimeloyl-ACP methyl ester carboxylesterase
MFVDIAELLGRYNERDAERRFAAEHLPALRERGLTRAGESSLLRQFRRPQARGRRAVLEQLTGSCPVADLFALEALEIPTLVLFAQPDLVHPTKPAEVLASRLPIATLREVPSRDRGDDLHREAIAGAIGEFLDELDERKEQR